MTPEQKMKESKKKRKEKFLEHYFAICIEHGFCIDADCADEYFLYLADWPNCIITPAWDEYKRDLRSTL